MTKSVSAVDIVLALVRVINGELPRTSVEAYLDPSVIIHMDATTYCGITTWYKWIYLIRNCGRVRDLTMMPLEARSDAQNPQLVHLSMRWSGINRSTGAPSSTPDLYHLRYLVQNGRLVEIWTHKINYTFIFGSWIRFSVFYRLFFGWAILHFARLWLQGRDFRVDQI